MHHLKVLSKFIKNGQFSSIDDAVGCDKIN